MAGSSKVGPPKHQNRYAWKPNANTKKNETEVGGKFRPFSEVSGVCQRCKDQIEWKRKYGKYKPLVEPAKCQQCSKRAVRQAYHNLCTACAKERGVCAKCSCRVEKIVGRDMDEREAEQRALDEAIANARERDRRTLMRALNKGDGVAESSSKGGENKVPHPTVAGESKGSNCQDNGCGSDEDVEFSDEYEENSDDGSGSDLE